MSREQLSRTEADKGFIVVLEPVKGHWQTEPVQRLRLALKALLRGYGLRCTECRPASPRSRSDGEAG